MRPRLLRLLLNGKSLVILIKFNDPIPFRIINMIGKYQTAFRIDASLDDLCKTAAIKDVITEDQGNLVIFNETFPDHESLGKPVWDLLGSIGKGTSQLRSVTQQFFKMWQIIGG